MEPTSSAARVAVHSLLSLLAEGASRHAALSLLHERALKVSGGRASVLFEPHPTTGHLHPTSGAGLDLLAIDPWVPEPGESRLVAQAFTQAAPLAVRDLAIEMPRLSAQLGTRAAVLLPFSNDDRRIGLLAVGVTADPDPVAAALAASEVSAGFTLALELGRMRQREAFEQDVRQLLDDFTRQASATLDLRSALHPVCVSAARIFGADRMTIWLHDRVSRALEPLASSDVTLTGLDRPVRADDPLIPAAAALRAQRAGLATQPASVTATLTVPLRGYRRALGTLVFDGVRLEAGEDLALLERAEELGRRLSNALDTTQLLAAVAASRRDLEELFDAIPDLLLVVDESGSIVRVNRACADTVGVDAEALRRERLDSLISTDLVEWMQDSQESGADHGRRFDEPRFGGAFAVTLRRVESEHGRKRLLICRRLSQ